MSFKYYFMIAVSTHTPGDIHDFVTTFMGVYQNDLIIPMIDDDRCSRDILTSHRLPSVTPKIKKWG